MISGPGGLALQGDRVPGVFGAGRAVRRAPGPCAPRVRPNPVRDMTVTAR